MRRASSFVAKWSRMRPKNRIVHEVDLGQIRESLVAELGLAAKPFAQRPPAGWGSHVDAATGAALGGGGTAPHPPALLEPLQGRVDLAQLGRPEVADPLVEELLQVVAGGGPAQETQEDEFEAHGVNI